MKKVVVIISFLSHCVTGNSQNVGIGTTTPAASAQLEISSTMKGFLPPRMTAAQRDAIVGPAAGLMIYCSNCGQYGEWQGFNGTAWTNMVGGALTPPLGIGDAFQGGKIAYIFQPGDPGYVAGQTHGLIAAASDQSTGTQWGCSGTEITGAGGTALGTGNQNTIDIIAGCTTVGIAAKICSDLVLSGYSDWYLPSKDELTKLYQNRAAIGGFNNTVDYWSSSEFSSTSAWTVWFQDGIAYSNLSKGFSGGRVRAVRSF